MSLKKIKKSLLRDAARSGLAREEPGVPIEEVPGRGNIPGSRLRVWRSNQKSRLLAVRASLDREVALMRGSNGWVTLSKVEQVVCAIPAADGSDSAEVLSFDPNDLIDAGEAAVRVQKENNPNFSDKAPVYVSLDGGADELSVSLRAKALWIKTIPLAAVREANTSRRESPRQTLERARREIARAYEMLPGEVHIELRPAMNRPDADTSNQGSDEPDSGNEMPRP